MADGWPLVGRAEEMELLEATALGGHARGVVISGAAGVGKSRLAAELLRWAAGSGWSTAEVRTSSAMADVPFGAYAALLPGSLDGAGSQAELLGRCLGELGRRSGGRRLLLAVDDAQLLDRGSAALSHLVASAGLGFVVVTVRRGEAVPDPIMALWKDGLAERIDLQALSEAEVGELLCRVVAGQVEARTRRRLWEVSGGNPLFLRELVLEGRERGALADRGGVWSWSGPLVGGTRLPELVEARLGGLDAAGRRLLEVLALGEPLSPELVDWAGAADELARLEAKGLVAVASDGRRTSMRVAHPLYAEALRTTMGPLQRAMLHRQLAGALAATGARRRDDVLRLAAWRVEGGDAGPLHELVAAARQARSLFDHALAERLARRGRDQGGGVELQLALADALYWQGRHGEAQEVLDGIDAASGEDRDDEAVAGTAIVLASNLMWGLGRAGDAEHVLTRTADSLGAGPWRQELMAHLAGLALFGGGPDRALRLAEEVLADPRGSDRAALRALSAAVPAWAMCGRSERAVRAARGGHEAAQHLAGEEAQLSAELLQAHVVALWLAGQLDDAEEIALGQTRAIAARGLHDFAGVWTLLLGRLALARGKATTARWQLREAAAQLRSHDPAGLLPWCLAVAAQADALLHDDTAASEALDEGERRRNPAVRIHEFEVLLARAWVAAAGDEHSSARRFAREAAGLARERGCAALELMALHDGLRLGDGDEVVEPLRGLAPSVEGRWAPLFADHARAWVDPDGPGLDGVAARFADLGAPLLAAEAAAGAGEAHRRSGLRGAEAASRRRSQAWAAECEGARTPVLERAAQGDDVDWLTRREREVAELAARGLTKREIAERLFVSVRTVGNHLNHVYGKLGLSDRAQLATVLDVEADRARSLVGDHGRGRRTGPH